jgi:hypothetical protein
MLQNTADIQARHEDAAETKRNAELDAQPDAALRLHEISTLLIQESNLDSLYNRILDAAMGLMSADMASMQLFHPKRSELELLAYTGFHPESAAFWEWVHLDSASSCGLALTAGCRVVVPDTETSALLAGTADLDAYYRRSLIDEAPGASCRLDWQPSAGARGAMLLRRESPSASCTAGNETA